MWEHYAKKKKSDRERQTLYGITCGINKLMNVTKKKPTHRYREHTSSYQWGEGKEDQ